MIEAGAPSTEGYVACSYGVPAPPGVVMVAPPTTLCNEEGAKRRPRYKTMGKARPRAL
jgi:hypothetical protein